MQISIGLPDPRAQSSMPALNRVLGGIKRTRLHSSAPKRIRLSITAQVLRQIQESLDTSHNPEKAVLWATAKQWFVAQIRNTLTAIGLPQQDYVGHSFRIGAATTEALAGIENSVTMPQAEFSLLTSPEREISHHFHYLSSVLNPRKPTGKESYLIT